MKNIVKILILSVISISFLACEKTAVVDITVPYNGAQFKVYNFAFTRSAPATGASAVTFNSYANDVKFAAVVSTTNAEGAAGLGVGGVSPARGYSLVPAGSNVVFKAITPVNAVPNATYGFGPGLEIANVVASVENGKNYSFYVNGFFDPATKKADGFVIEDKLPSPDTSAAYIRLVNPAPNTTGLSLDLIRTVKINGVDVVETTTPITGVAFKTGSEFVRVPSGTYTLKCIDVATGKSIARTTATSLLKNRVYTFTVRGDLVGTTSYPTLFLDFTENR